MQVTIKTRGLGEIERFWQQRALNFAGGPRVVEVYAKGKRNQVIAEAQAAQDRNPFFVTRSESSKLAGLMRDALSIALRDRARASTFKALLLESIGGSLVDFYRAHIRARKSGGVPPISSAVSQHQTRKLTPEYAKWKQRKWGKKLPELIASGQFIESITARVR